MAPPRSCRVTRAVACHRVMCKSHARRQFSAWPGVACALVRFRGLTGHRVDTRGAQREFEARGCPFESRWGCDQPHGQQRARVAHCAK